MNPGPDLSQLKDIHLPPAIGWWPPAPGWWLLALVVLPLLLALGYYLRRYRQRSYRRAALRELRNLRENAAGIANRQSLEQMAALLRRVAIQSCGRARVAPLSGAAWLAFLDQSGRTDQFSAGPGRVLGTDLYRATVAADLEQLFPLVERWIRRHRPC